METQSENLWSQLETQSETIMHKLKRLSLVLSNRNIDNFGFIQSKLKFLEAKLKDIHSNGLNSCNLDLEKSITLELDEQLSR